MSASIQARFDRYSPDNHDEAEFRRRAEKSGRTLGEQIRYEDDLTDAVNARFQREAAERYRARVKLWGGAGWYDRTDPWPSHRGHLRDDPMGGEWA